MEKPESNHNPPLFARPFFLSLTIGIPFCIFKILFGMSALREGGDQDFILKAIGFFILIWAGTDFFMNSGRIIIDLLNKESSFDYCTIGQAGRYLGRPLVFLAIDTLLTFLIICFMLWSGWITHLSVIEQYFWYAATTLNLISLSIVSLYNEIHKL